MSELRRNTTPQAIDRARDLRKSMGRAEKRLWYDGLAKSRWGFYFRRQYAFGPYFLDFYGTESRVCVEVDGDQHEFSAEHDVVRLRFGSDSVMIDLPHILYRVRSECEGRAASQIGGASGVSDTPPPTLPSPIGMGEA